MVTFWMVADVALAVPPPWNHPLAKAKAAVPAPTERTTAVAMVAVRLVVLPMVVLLERPGCDLRNVAGKSMPGVSVDWVWRRAGAAIRRCDKDGGFAAVPR
ncbi:hypothetical protein [Actinoplanes sp. NPDC049118]|uniref:hypothetical protein n=1 Tax=Actinoplanes sp. NPDC049118 TaxID=3155769 RepID=UPI0033D0866D